MAGRAAGKAAGGEAAAAVEGLSYTEASSELDEIVVFFEQREVDVDQLVARLERATAIVDELDRRLRRTRAQVEELLPRLAAVTATSAAAGTTSPAHGDVTDGDGRPSGEEIDAGNPDAASQLGGGRGAPDRAGTPGLF